jgi:hypothetical protein
VSETDQRSAARRFQLEDKMRAAPFLAGLAWPFEMSRLKKPKSTALPLSGSIASSIIDDVISRVLVCFAWLIVLLALAAMLRIPGKAIDIYIHDVYIPLNMLTLIALIVLLFGAPLAALTVRVFRSKHT